MAADGGVTMAGAGSGSLGRAAEWLEPDSVWRRVVGLFVLGCVDYGIVAAGGARDPVVLALTAAASVAFLFRSVGRGSRPWAAMAALTTTGVAGGMLGVLTLGPAFFFPFVAAHVAGRWLSPRLAAAQVLLTMATIAVPGLLLGRLGPLAVLGLSVALVAAALTGVNQAARVRVQEQAELIVAEHQVILQERARTAALDERARIAREIHDVLAHSLSGLSVQLEAAHLLLTRHDDQDRAAEHVERARGLARTGLEETRRALRALRGGTARPDTAVAELVESYRADTGCAASLRVEGTPRPLSAEAGNTVHRVAQEALTNARRHAPGSGVEVRIAYEEEAVRLTVADHRSDPPAGPPEPGSGYGLVGMRERAELLGGRLSAGPDGDGWRIDLTVPA
ncbi:sensor histidine kinase [Saccharopolyspora rosea]|uniref:histidine kinase n=1 Tax=Saccharopolyspora rosea TaxID=524884 RepID=A0ABW3G4Q2_9PSEU|nr:sensor histidine kinase [Saccharopolyspora rosea]